MACERIDRGNITRDHELHLIGIKGNLILLISAGEHVSTTAPLGGGPVAGLYDLVAARGTKAIIAVEGVPIITICTKGICKAEVNRTVNGGDIAVSAIIVVGHLNSLAGVPTLS